MRLFSRLFSRLYWRLHSRLFSRLLSPLPLIALLTPSLSGLALSPLVRAADAPPEELLVTGTYSPRVAVTSSTSVLEAAQISAANKRSLAGLLKTVPGLLVEEQGGAGGLTAVSVRGGEANFTLVMLDGVPVNDPTNTRGGGFDFANLNSALVERIEVVRGAQSVVYGSDALAGVINIVTRPPEIGHRQSLAVETGEDDYSDVRFSAQGRADAMDYTLELTRRDEGDALPGSERDSDSATLRLGWQPGQAHAFSLGYRYLEGERHSYPEQSGGPTFALTDELDRADYDDQLFDLGWRMRVNHRWRSVLRANYFEHREQYTSPGIPPYLEVPPNGAETDFERTQLQWINTLDVGGAVEIDTGADWRREEGESRGYVEFFGFRNPTDFELQRDSAAVFATATATPDAASLFNASVRFDNPEDFDSETTWRLGAKRALGAGISLSANWGEAFKLPSFFALGNALVGNPDLEPERAESWDAGIHWAGDRAWRLSLTWFHNDFKDLIDFDDETFRNVNRQNVETSGAELEAHWQPHAAISLRANGTYTDIDVRGEDTVLTGRPEWTAGLLVLWRMAPAWDTALDYRYGGEQWATSRHTGEAVSEKLADYHRVDWVLGWSPSPRWKLRLSVDNLFDEHYETAVGFSAADRAVRFGITFNN